MGTLTEADRTLVKNLFSQGPSALLDEGLSMEQIRDFLARPECADYMSVLLGELDHVVEIEARSRMIARRGLTRLRENAVVVVAMALAGPQYLTHEDPKTGQQVVTRDAKNQPLLLRPEPTQQQVKAATLVLDCMGVPTQKSTITSGGPPTMGTLFKKDDTERRAGIDADPGTDDEGDRRRSRDRMRILIQRVAPEIPAIRARIGCALGLTNGKVKKKVRKKKVKKKVVKKKAMKKKARKGRAVKRGKNGRKKRKA